MIEGDFISIPVDSTAESIIKVIGVGGGGGNAVNHLYKQGLQNITFLVSNTDKQALGKLDVPAKLQLGPTGLGAGGDPTVARNYADADRDHIREALKDGTKMLFIVAGMGGGTGTGASPIIAEVAQEEEILTVGIVTIPFAFEKGQKIRKAMIGVSELAKHVDALLIINNEKLKEIYPIQTFIEAFSKSNDVVADAARAIAEIITIPGLINTDFADVYNTLHKGGMAILSVGRAGGEERITNAINDALNSPLMNNSNVEGAKRLLLQFYSSQENAIRMEEFDQINDFVNKIGNDVEVQWGIAIDDTMNEDVRVTIITTGYGIEILSSLDNKDDAEIDDVIQQYYPNSSPQKKNKDEQTPTIDLTDMVSNTDSLPGTDAPGEIVVTEEPQHNEPKQPQRRGFGKWVRGER